MTPGQTPSPPLLFCLEAVSVRLASNGQADNAQGKQVNIVMHASQLLIKTERAVVSLWQGENVHSTAGRCEYL